MSRKSSMLLFTLAALHLLLASACCRSNDQVWDDTKTCGRHINRGFRSLGGKQCSSRQVRCREDFYPVEDNWCEMPDSCGTSFEMGPEDLAMADFQAPPPRQSPGDPGSGVPGIGAFQSPQQQKRWQGVFRNIYFPYNSNQITGNENSTTLRQIATYMRNNPRTLIFVEGHCDERGAEAYNMALGSRRANAVRTQLINEGVNPDNIYTISYGKERPATSGSDEKAWSMNRRAEFKIYEK